MKYQKHTQILVMLTFIAGLAIGLLCMYHAVYHQVADEARATNYYKSLCTVAPLENTDTVTDSTSIDTTPSEAYNASQSQLHTTQSKLLIAINDNIHYQQEIARLNGQIATLQAIPQIQCTSMAAVPLSKDQLTAQYTFTHPKPSCLAKTNETTAQTGNRCNAEYTAWNTARVAWVNNQLATQ